MRSTSASNSIGGNVVDASALLAHEMPVRAGEVKERRPVRLVHVLDESPLVQRVERPVHGRQMDLRDARRARASRDRRQ